MRQCKLLFQLNLVEPDEAYFFPSNLYLSQLAYYLWVADIITVYGDTMSLNLQLDYALGL